MYRGYALDGLGILGVDAKSCEQFLENFPHFLNLAKFNSSHGIPCFVFSVICLLGLLRDTKFQNSIENRVLKQKVWNLMEN